MFYLTTHSTHLIYGYIASIAEDSVRTKMAQLPLRC